MSILFPEELKFLINPRLKQEKSNVSFSGKTVVISGATSGVGKASLEEFVKHNAHVVMVARNPEKADNLIKEMKAKYKAHIDLVLCDFRDFEDIKKAAEEIKRRFAHIHVLINSVGVYQTKKEYTEDGIEVSFMVNHLGVFLFTVLLLPKLKSEQEGRIIQVNSQGHRFNGLKVKDVNFRKRIYTGLRGYGQSKVAQLYTVYELANRLKGSGVTINAMHPGAVKSNIGTTNGFLYRIWSKIFIQPFLRDPQISADAIYYLASAEELSDVSGKFFDLTIMEKPAWHAMKKDKQKQVWDLTLEMCGLNKDLEV